MSEEPFPRYGRTIATTLKEQEYNKLQAIAKGHNVTISEYVRAIIIDALVEEEITDVRI